MLVQFTCRQELINLCNLESDYTTLAVVLAFVVLVGPLLWPLLVALARLALATSRSVIAMTFRIIVDKFFEAFFWLLVALLGGASLVELLARTIMN
jgi:hypothetical protein